MLVKHCGVEILSENPSVHPNLRNMTLLVVLFPSPMSKILTTKGFTIQGQQGATQQEAREIPLALKVGMSNGL